MKLSLGSHPMIVDVDFAATVDVSPRYAEVVDLLCAATPEADHVARLWLDHMWRESSEPQVREAA